MDSDQILITDSLFEYKKSPITSNHFCLVTYRLRQQ